MLNTQYLKLSWTSLLNEIARHDKNAGDKKDGKNQFESLKNEDSRSLKGCNDKQHDEKQHRERR